MAMQVDTYFQLVNELLSESFDAELSDEGKLEFYNMASEYGSEEVLTSLGFATDQYDDIQTAFTMLPRILANRRKVRRMFRKKANKE